MDTQLINWQKLERLYPQTACAIKQHSSKSLQEYSSWLWNAPQPNPVDADFATLLSQHLQTLGQPTATIQQILKQLSLCPSLQTTHHVTPTNGPTFATADLVALCGKPEDYIYLVGACTGIAFSNAAWSGALSYFNTPLHKLVKKSSKTWHKALRAEQERASKNEQRLSLIAAKNRDALVFKAPQDYLLMEVWQDLDPQVQQLLGTPEHQFYSEWALQSCQNIQKQLLGSQQIVYFDLSMVVSDYIQQKLGTTTELDWLIAPKPRAEVEKMFGNQNLFLTTKLGKKSAKVKRLDCQQVPTNLDWIQQSLATGQFCPSIFLIFFVLLCMLGFHCWGSFYQMEYLHFYAQGWQSLGYKPQIQSYLASGRLLKHHVPAFEHHALWPLDQVLSQQPLKINTLKNTKMQYLWQPLLQKLV